MHSSELRKKFRDFFLSRNHVEIPSSSLIPDKSDPTVLLCTAGMQPLVPYLMGAPFDKGKRIFDTQKCFRTPDIEEVGDDTHHTFFEMLGNWSLGDYFKKEAIELAYDFFVDVLKFDPKTFGITIFKGDKDAPRDNEAEAIWISKGLRKDQIYEFDKKDNFWGPAGKTGPCGPCSEIHIDRGEKYGCGKDDCGPNCDHKLADNSPCLRYVEMWNLVFMEYNKKEDGSYEKLAQKNVDTGAGFERLVAFMNKKDSAFDTDIFENIIKKIEELTGKKYNDNKRSFRVIADHARASTFLIADGVIPGNSGREYILKRILRRAVMHGQKLGIKDKFMSKVAEVVIQDFSGEYPELKEREAHIYTTLNAEEDNFLRTLDRGERMLKGILTDSRFSNNSSAVITGKEAFELFDTYGFPFELTEEIAEEKGIKIDKEGFKEEMKKHQEKSREGGKKMFEYAENLKAFENLPKTIFNRDKYELEAAIIQVKQSDKEANTWFVALNETPFYAESGGQVADTGTLEIEGKIAKVIDVQKNPNGVFIHRCKAEFDIKKEIIVKAKIHNRREQIRRHHSATHLLHAALRKVLGNHVEQAGSEVSENRTRFDFSHSKNVNKEEIYEVENMIADWVAGAYPAIIKEMPIEEAQSKGAMALFSDKFEKGQIVRTIKFGDFSFELCGGIHVHNTAEIGAVKIVSEGSIASGVRRIEMICSLTAQKLLQENYEKIENLANKLKTPSEKLEERVENLMKEKKEAEEILNKLIQKIAEQEAKNLVKNAKYKNAKKYLVVQIESDNLGEMARTVAKEVDVAVFFNKKCQIAVATNGNVNAKDLLLATGAKGGGSDHFAQGGALKLANNDVEKIVEENL